MSQAAPVKPAALEYAPPPLATVVPETNRVLLKKLLWLAAPIVVEQFLSMGVGLTDVYLAGHLGRQAAAATAAVGSVSYILWLIGLIAGAIGTGSTALIARATGARHRSLANSVCGQTVTAAVLAGGGRSAPAPLFPPPGAGGAGGQGGGGGPPPLFFRPPP